MKKSLCLCVLLCTLMGAGLYAQGDAAPQRKWHVEVGLENGAFILTGSMPHLIGSHVRRNNAYQGISPLQHFQRVPQISPGVQAKVTYAIGNQYTLGIGLQYQWMRYQELIRWEWPDGNVPYMPDMISLWQGNAIQVHKAGLPLSLSRTSLNGHHRLGLQVTPQLFLSGTSLQVHKEKFVGKDVVDLGATFPIQLTTRELHLDDYFSYDGFRKVCVQALARYDYGFSIRSKWLFVGGGISYSINPYQYRTDMENAPAVYFGNINPYLKSRMLGFHAGVSIQL